MRMQIMLLLGIAAGLSASAVSAQTNTNSAVFSSEKEKASYAIGQGIGMQLKRQYLDVDLKVLMESMKDSLAGHPSKLTDREAMETIQRYMQEARLAVAKKNQKLGDEFLAANKKKPGVQTHPVTLPDGTVAELQYKILTEGTGTTPGSNDTVTVNIRGTLIDGTEYDNTSTRKTPPKFGVRNTQPGIGAALQMMKVGSKWILYLPANLAFGNYGSRNVEPGSTVICELELLGDEAPKPVTSDIIRVPSAEEMKKGAKIETIKAEDVDKMTASPTNTTSGH